MVYTIKHRKVSGKADATDSTLVRPSAWNDDHDLQMSEGVIIGRPPGSGTGPGQEIPLSSIYMPGMMVMWPGGTAPVGWLFCQGQSLLRADYPALFGVIGLSYNTAADSTHFSLPDYRGRIPAGVDGSGRLTTATMTNPHLLGGVGGAEQEQAYADINVGAWASGGGYSAGGYTTGAQSVNYDTYTDGPADGGTSVTGGGGGAANAYHVHAYHVHVNTGGENLTVAINSFGASGGGYTRAVTNVQPTLTVNFIIKS
jgi:microcystin-dependent protein